MRQKDFVEVAAVLGDEVRLCDGQELEGLLAAFNALVGHARFRYPEVDAGVVVDRFCSAVEHGTVTLADIAGPTAPGPGEIMQAIGAAGADSYARDAWSMVRRIATQPQMPAFDPFGSCWTCGAPRVAEVRARGMVLVCSVDTGHNPDGYQPRVEVGP